MGTTYRELISAIGALKCARQFVPPSTLETQYHSLIRPYLDCYSVVWEGLDSEFSLKLQKLQNRVARIITFLSYDSICPLLQELGWDELTIRRIK